MNTVYKKVFSTTKLLRIDHRQQICCNFLVGLRSNLQVGIYGKNILPVLNQFWWMSEFNSQRIDFYITRQQSCCRKINTNNKLYAISTVLKAEEADFFPEIIFCIQYFIHLEYTHFNTVYNYDINNITVSFTGIIFTRCSHIQK